MSATICPNCGTTQCNPFYEVAGVPTNSCLLVNDREAALAFPTGNIVLTICHGCGFIFNGAWDPQCTVYSDQYEETQGFSATFNAFNRSLAEELIERYAVSGKRVLEIGCGKGEFLSLICGLGANSGIGYDPSFVPERQRPNENVQFKSELFTENTNEVAPDLLCCKMTLEHVGQPRQLVNLVRSVANRQDSVIFFQVPDVERILGEGAFWDVYYEHCSYFGSASLCRLFSQAGFAVRRVWTGYDGQYLMIVASPTAKRSDSGAGDGSDIDAIVRASGNFAAEASRSRAAWLHRLRDWAASGHRTVLWGSGSKAVAFLTTLGLYEEIEHVVDINPYRVDKFLPGTGQRIVAPAFLRDCRADNVVIMNPVYRSEVEGELARQRCEPRVYTILDSAATVSV